MASLAQCRQQRGAAVWREASSKELISSSPILLVGTLCKLAKVQISLLEPRPGAPPPEVDRTLELISHSMAYV